jgi:hypothetical protein
MSAKAKQRKPCCVKKGERKRQNSPCPHGGSEEELDGSPPGGVQRDDRLHVLQVVHLNNIFVLSVLLRKKTSKEGGFQFSI